VCYGMGPRRAVLIKQSQAYMMAPPYFGAPKFANAMSNPPGYFDLASGGKVICAQEKI